MLETLSIKPYPKFVLLQDSFNISATRIFLSILSNHVLVEKNVVHLLCAESHPNKYKPQFGDKINYSNLTGEAQDTENIVLTILQSQNPVIVFVDSISELAWKLGANIFQVLKKGLQNSNLLQLTAILHADCTQAQLNMQERLSHIASVNIKLYTTESQQRLSFLYNKRTGKLVNTQLQFELKNNQVVSKKITTSIKKENDTSTTTPESLASFRIGLGHAEKESRDKMVLPYIKAKENILSKPTNEGKVFYELDEGDDWDEEDPDDDLDV